jgi:hypothetical protein
MMNQKFVRFGVVVVDASRIVGLFENDKGVGILLQGEVRPLYVDDWKLDKVLEQLADTMEAMETKQTPSDIKGIEFILADKANLEWDASKDDRLTKFEIKTEELAGDKVNTVKLKSLKELEDLQEALDGPLALVNGVLFVPFV